MGQADFEIEQSIAGMRQRERALLLRDRAKYGVDESGSAGFSSSPGLRNRIVDGSRDGNAIEVDDLIRGEPEDVQDLEVELRQRALGEVCNERIELSLPAQRSCHELCRERPVALVRETWPDASNGGRQIDSAGADVVQGRQRRRSCRRNHGSVAGFTNLAPVAS